MKRIRGKSFIFILIIIIVFSMINIFNPYKPNVSEMENRNLSNIKDFTKRNYFTGEFFESFDAWFSDTFIFRDKCLSLSSKIKNVLSLDRFLKNANSVSIIGMKNDDGDVDIDDETRSYLDNVNNGMVDIEINDYIYDDGFRGHTEGLGRGYILYNDVAYVRINFDFHKAIKYLEVMKKYSEAFDNVRISIVLAPQSSILLYGNKNVDLDLLDQNAAINSLAPFARENIHIVNPCKKILDHRNEYLFFKYDHHWTQRGAYYAYQAFCESIGETAVPISEMKEKIINLRWEGSSYSFTYDERLKGKTDEVYAYISTRSNVMKVYTKNNQVIETDNCIRDNFVSYVAFISGDNPFTIISVDSNPQDKCCIVLKDSFGCAFVPYLVNNYGTIFVIDPRYTNFDFVSALKPFKIKDFISVSAIYEPCNDKYIKQANDLIEKYTN